METSPISGHYPEYSFGERFNSSLWVEFKEQAGDVWYGCFAKLWDTGYNHVLLEENESSAFIVAGGKGYLVNLQNKNLLFQTEDFPTIESAIKTDNPDYFIASTFYGIYVIDRIGEIKTVSPDFSTDGIVLIEQKGEKVLGLLDSQINQYESKYNFELDLNTFEIVLTGKEKPESRLLNSRPKWWQRIFYNRLKI